MVKIDGSQRIICSLLVLYSVTAVATEQLRLQVKNMAGKVVDTVAVGEFFTVCVTILDSTIRDNPPHISTDPVIPLRWSGKIIERVDTTHMANQYQYRGYVDTPGDYVIGPATVKNQGGIVTSSTCVLRVDEQSAKKTGQSVAPQPRLVLDIPESKIVVGQRIPVVLTFYYTDKSTRIVNTMQESLTDVTLKDQERTTTGTKELDGSTYYFVQFNLYLTAHKSGTFSIPAFCVDYQVEQREKRSVGFGFFELTQYENKRVYSNMFKLQVDQLPPHQGAVFAVGTFDTIKLHAQPTTAQQGEAIVLTLEVTGDTDWDLLHAPKLEDIPQGLRWYDSQESLMPDRSKVGRMIKRFEYVVQGLEHGIWTIPGQTFTVFDTTGKKYKTMQSDPVTITILKDDASVIVSSNDDHQQEQSSQSQVDVQEGVDLPLHEQGPWSSYPAREPLSISFFILLLLIPFMCMCCMLVSSNILVLIVRHRKRAQERTVFVRSKIALHKARDGLKPEQIYYIMINLFADKYRIDSRHINLEFIDQKLANAGCSAHIIAEWHKFFVQISSHVFGVAPAHTSSHLFTQALYWIELLEKYL